MIKAEVLEKIGFKELIGTSFEELITIKTYKAEENIYFNSEEKIEGQFVIAGSLRYTMFVPDGGEYYFTLEKNDLLGVGFSVLKGETSKEFIEYEFKISAKEDSIVAKIPFKKIFKLDFKNKEKILEKLTLLLARENVKLYKYFMYKSSKSDEELFLKALELGHLEGKKTREISEEHNIHIRNLQRAIKRLMNENIIRKVNNSYEIVDINRLQEYRKKFDK